MISPEIHCSKSISILGERCRRYFAKREVPTIPKVLDEMSSTTGLFSQSEENADLLFFGGMIRRLLELKDLPIGQAKLWVLSHTYYQILTEVFNFSPKAIGVVPRQQLFALPEAILPFPDFSVSQPICLVYAGRISATKNIESLLRLVSCLQTQFHYPVELRLYGAFDDEVNLNGRMIFRKNYQTHLQAVVQELPWNISPRFENEVGPYEWIDLTPPDAVLINLSTYFQEDFGVSVAQWSELGRPMIISDWGGHRDLGQDNILKIPVRLIAQSDQADYIKRELALQLAQYISSTKPHRQVLEFHGTDSPPLISGEELKIGINAFVQRYADIVELIQAGLWEEVMEKESGRELMLKLSHCFLGRPEKQTDLVFCPSHHLEARKETQQVEQIFSAIVQELRSPEVFYTRDAAFPFNRKRLLLAHSIHFTYFSVDLLPLIRFLVQYLGEGTVLAIHISSWQEPAITQSLQGILREIDQLIIH